jgi:hypothetical protein
MLKNINLNYLKIKSGGFYSHGPPVSAGSPPLTCTRSPHYTSIFGERERDIARQKMVH